MDERLDLNPVDFKPWLSVTTCSDGRSRVTDRRVVELQPDGSRLVRDPVTKQGFDQATGQPNPL